MARTREVFQPPDLSGLAMINCKGPTSYVDTRGIGHYDGAGLCICYKYTRCFSGGDVPIFV